MKHFLHLVLALYRTQKKLEMRMFEEHGLTPFDEAVLLATRKALGLVELGRKYRWQTLNGESINVVEFTREVAKILRQKEKPQA